MDEAGRGETDASAAMAASIMPAYRAGVQRAGVDRSGVADDGQVAVPTHAELLESLRVARGGDYRPAHVPAKLYERGRAVGGPGPGGDMSAAVAGGSRQHGTNGYDRGDGAHLHEASTPESDRDAAGQPPATGSAPLTPPARMLVNDDTLDRIPAVPQQRTSPPASAVLPESPAAASPASESHESPGSAPSVPEPSAPAGRPGDPSREGEARRSAFPHAADPYTEARAAPVRAEATPSRAGLNGGTPHHSEPRVAQPQSSVPHSQGPVAHHSQLPAADGPAAGWPGYGGQPAYGSAASTGSDAGRGGHDPAVYESGADPSAAAPAPSAEAAAHSAGAAAPWAEARAGADPQGHHGYQLGGHDRSGYESRGYDSGDREPSDYDRYGTDRPERRGHEIGGYDPSGYHPGDHDSSGPDSSGPDSSGPDPSRHDVSGYDPSGHDVSGYEAQRHRELPRQRDARSAPYPAAPHPAAPQEDYAPYANAPNGVPHFPGAATSSSAIARDPAAARPVSGAPAPGAQLPAAPLSGGPVPGGLVPGAPVSGAPAGAGSGRRPVENDPAQARRRDPYERSSVDPTPAPTPAPVAYGGAPPFDPLDPSVPVESVEASLPHRVPAPPDVPDVDLDDIEDEIEDPTPSDVDGGSLTRIASGLRTDARSAIPDELDVDAVLAAVQHVDGVREAVLRGNPGGVQTLRLELADGADPGRVSRQVARLLKERMGIAAEPRRPEMDSTHRGAPPRTGPVPPSSFRPPLPGGTPPYAAPQAPHVNGTSGGPPGPASAPMGRPAGGAPAMPAGPVAGADMAANPDAARSGPYHHGVANHRAPQRPAAGRAHSVPTGPGGMPTESGAVHGGAMPGGPSAPNGVPRPPLNRPASLTDAPAPNPHPAIPPIFGAEPSPSPRVLLDRVKVATVGTEATVEVRLAASSGTYVGTASGPAVDAYLLRLAAQAAAGAIDSLVAHPSTPPVRCFIDHAGVVPFGSCLVAIAVVLVSGEGWVEHLVGSALVAGDPRQAIVRATLAAVNRRLDSLFD